MKKRLLALLLAASMFMETGAPALAAQPGEVEHAPVAEDTEVDLPEGVTEEVKPGTDDDAESAEQPGTGGEAEDAEQPGTGGEAEEAEQPGTGSDTEDTDQPGTGDDSENEDKPGTDDGVEDTDTPGTGEETEDGNLPAQEDDPEDPGTEEYEGIEEGSYDLPFEIGGTDIFAGIDAPAGYAVDGASANDAKYDPRGWAQTTSIKNQNPWGTCWAFATMAVLENSMIRQGLADSIDLSERHLAYFAFHTGSDRLGNASGDTITSTPSSAYLDMGGNGYMSAVKLMNWHGAANESSYQYSNADTAPADLSQSAAQAGDVMAHDLYFIPTKNASESDKKQVIKEMIIKYGCVGWSYWSEAKYYTGGKTSGHAYYCPDKTSTNHAITVVGWDDNYSRENFGTYKPENNGAWIIKNSWGTNRGENGYHYISYEDTSLGSSNPAFVAVASRRTGYDNNYFYGNTLNTLAGIYSRTCRKAAQVFQVKAGEDREKLKAVSMMVFSDQAEYSIQVYKNPVMVNGIVENPESGQSMLAEPVTGKTGYAGLYTIDLPKPVYFSKGDYVSVVISFSSPAQLYLDRSSEPVSYTNSITGKVYTISSTNMTRPGQSFYSNSTSSTIWRDDNNDGVNSRINLLTQNTTDRIVKFLDLDGNLLSEQEVPKGSSATPPAAPEIPGYTFKGWSGSYTNITDDIELTPEYEPVTYTITYELSGGINAAGNPVSYTIETDAVLLSDPERDGYIFAGWYEESDFSGIGVSRVAGGATGDLTLYARWLRDDGTVITPVFVPKGEILEEGQSVVIKANKNAEIYYTLDGTKPAKSSGTKYTAPIEITKDTTVKAIAVLNGQESQVAEVSYTYYLMRLLFSQPEYNVILADTTALELAQLPATKSKSDVTWKSQDESIAAVSSSGVVTGVKKGTTTILAATKDYKGNPVTARCQVHVVKGGRVNDLIWTLSDEGLLTISGRGDFESSGWGTGIKIPWSDFPEEIRSVRMETTGMTSTRDLFSYCNNLESADLTQFDAGSLKDASGMFVSCGSLEELDLSMMDGSRTSLDSIVTYCTKLSLIYTPYHVSGTISLPAENGESWYQPDGTKITKFPQKLEYSTIIAKGKIPDLSGFRLEAAKTKTVYECGDTLDLDDLTVLLYDKKEVAREITGYQTNADTIDMDTPGIKTLIITYNVLRAEVAVRVIAEDGQPTGVYAVFFDLGGHGAAIEPLTDVKEGSLLGEPEVQEADGYRFLGWYKDAACTTPWDFDSDVVESDMTLYAGWLAGAGAAGGMYIRELRPQSYTGSALKPSLSVYAEDGVTSLISGKDYTVKYYNNINADQSGAKGGVSRTGQEGNGGFTKALPYAVITGKGNYKGSIHLNFHIEPVSLSDDNGNLAAGFTLKYTDQAATDVQAQKPFGSLKYKKSMKLGKDFTLALEDADGRRVGSGANPSIGKGRTGVFTLKITGMGNYKGTAEKEVYAAAEKYLMKNITVAVGEKISAKPYTGSAVTLLPGYPAKDGNYYSVGTDLTHRKASQDRIFMAWSTESYLVYGRDFEIRYQNNRSVGTATMKLVGIGKYTGVKNVKFRITGTAFNSRNVTVSGFRTEMDYTGNALRQNVSLTTSKGKKLDYGADYTVSYKNNVKKGTATVTFKARPASGYSGSFKKTFKIQAAGLAQNVQITEVDASGGSSRTISNGGRFGGTVYYTKSGAKLSGRVVLTSTQTGAVLQEGKDYKVSYSNNKTVTTNAVMTITGKGNFTGSLKVTFGVSKTPLQMLSVTDAPAYYSQKKKEYRPVVRLKDQKTVLKAGKDYEIEYHNYTQGAVEAYLEILEKGGSSAKSGNIRPYASVSAKREGNYEGTVTVPLTIAGKKLSKSTLYVVVEEASYTGGQVCPEAAVYYGDAKAVKAAAKAKETSARALTTTHKLTRLRMYEDGAGDYTLTYGANRTAGKNKGSVTVTGRGLYGGSVTVKFTIAGKDL